MRPFIRASLFYAAAILFAAKSLFAQVTGNISKIEIRHVGPAAAADELIQANIRTKVGDPYVRSTIDDDVRNLYSTGFFYNIQVVESQEEGGVALAYVVQAKPRLVAIKIEGNKKYSDSKLRKKISSKIGEPLDEHKLFNDAEELKKMYQKAGYAATEVKYSVSIEESTGTGQANFEVTETPKVKINSLEFEGAEAFKQSQLRKVMKVGRWGWFWAMIPGSKTFKTDKFEEGKERLTEFYRNRGYIDFDIKDANLQYPAPNRVDIALSISEGKQYMVGAIDFHGNEEFPTEDVSRGLKMKVGDTFTPEGLAKDVEAVEDFYGSKGHIDVTQSSGDLRVARVPNTETGTMDLDFQIKEGQKSYVEKIQIRGNNKTKDKVIRRELALSPGETFDMTRVKLSRKRLEGLQYFSKVEARPEPTDVPNRKDLVIDVEEKSTGNLSFGAGFSTVDAIVGFVEVSQGNFDLFNPPTFTGGGQKMRLRVQYGTQRQDYTLSFVEPWFLDRKLSLGVDLYHRALDFQSSANLYNETRTGGKVSLTRALGSDFLIGSVSYTMENVGIVDVDASAPLSIQNEKGNSLLSKAGISLAYDTRNSTMLPDKGQRTELSADLASSPGDHDFYKVELKTSWYLSVPKDPLKGILELNARAGVADSFSGGVPFYERYYLGGMYSLRGFDYRDVSPREYLTTNGVPTAALGTEPVGGNTYWFGSAEYSIPVIERVRLAMFYDIGNVYQGAFSFSTGDATGVNRPTYYDNWGVGIRLNLPIGPLRLDYGIPITHDSFSGGSGRFQFGVGYTREF